MGIYIKDMEMPKEGTVIAIYKLKGKYYASVHGTELYPLVSVPPQDVVRCKDCKHYWKNNPEAVAVCLASPHDDAYCSEGERRTDE